MIIRIQSEGQYRLDDDALAEINRLDTELGNALELDEPEFHAALSEFEDAVRKLGTRLADDELVASDVILPPSDATVEEVRAMLDDDGLVPG